MANIARFREDAQMSESHSSRLAALGLSLPPAPKPVAAYVPFARTGNLVFAFNYGTEAVDLPGGAIGKFLLGEARLASAGVAVGTAP